MENTNAILSDLDILQEMDKGRIVIRPFDKSQLSNCSYDVTLGNHIYRRKEVDPPAILNPWSAESVRNYWSVLETYDNQGNLLLKPGETVLAHTNEFIGGVDGITTMMKARSSLARSCISICKCAGWGDVGYVNRWTMEITNHSDVSTIQIPIGARVGQIVFMPTGPTSRKYKGKYVQKSEGWSPDEMLPKLWIDNK